MLWFRDLSFGTKVVLYSTLASAVALCLVVGSTSVFHAVDHRREVVRSLTIQADVLAINSTAALTFNDPSAAEESLRGLEAEPYIVHACIHDKNGEQFADYRRDGKREPRPYVLEEPGHRFEGNSLILVRSIVLDGERIGTIHIKYELTAVYAHLKRQCVIAGFVMLLSMGVAFLLSAKLQGTLVRPVTELAMTAKTVSQEKDYSVRAVRYGQDELGRLTDAFNEMLEQIQGRDTALQRVREGLEVRVRERTAQLTKANESLLDEIAERKRAEQELRKSEERHRAITETAQDAIITADAEGNIRFWNAAAEKIFGYRTAEVVGKNMMSLIVPPQYHEAKRKGFALFAKTGQGRAVGKTLELTALRKDGSEFPIEISVSGYQDHGGHVAIALVRDVTERKQTEEKVEELHRQLLDASRQAGMAEIAGGVLHNVGNVLTSANVSVWLAAEKMRKSRVSGLAKATELMSQHADDLGTFITADEKGKQLPAYLTKLAEHLTAEQAAVLEELASLQNNIEHIKSIISMQQSYAGIAGVVEPVAISDVLGDVLKMNAASFERHGIQVVQDYGEMPRPVLDKHKLLQILVNVVKNAKYAMIDRGGQDKRLTLRVRPGEEDRVRIEVIDNGVGISEDNLTRIFAYGFTTKKDGHGFGLHSSALMATEAGGSLTGSSDGLGKGATFTLELPLRVAEVSR